MKIEQESWNTFISDDALFFSSERHKYCLIAPKNLQQSSRKWPVNKEQKLNITKTDPFRPQDIRPVTKSIFVSQANVEIVLL